MTDKMMRISGRGEDGLAKAFSLTEKGETKISGLLEIAKRRSIEIASGETLVVFDKVPVNSNLFFYSIDAHTNHDYEVSYQWNAKDPNSSASYPTSILQTETYSSRFANSARIPVLGDRLWFRIKNNSPLTQMYNVYIWGTESNPDLYSGLNKIHNSDGTFTPIVSTDDVKMLNEDLLVDSNTTVEPGKIYGSPSRIGVGSSLGVAVQLRNAGQFEIYVSYRGRNHQREMARELIYRSDEGAMYGGGRTDKITNQYSVIIKNIGNTSFDIRDVVITDFI